MTLAAILEQHGYVPTVSTNPGRSGTPEIKQLCAVPTVPAVPTEKNETAPKPKMTIVPFRLPGGCPRSHCTAIGTRSRDEIIAELRQKHGTTVEILP
jgi:hypothetical protein